MAPAESPPPESSSNGEKPLKVPPPAPKTTIRQSFLTDLEKLLSQQPLNPQARGPVNVANFPPELKQILHELFLGDAKLRGLTRFGRDILREMGGTPEECASRGTDAFNHGLYSIAIDYFQDYLNRAQPPLDPALLNRAGLSCHYCGQNDRARPFFEQALQAVPNDANFVNNRGLTFFGEGQYAAAVQDFDRAIALDPTLAMAHWNKAFAEMKLGNASQALDALRAAIRLDPALQEKAWHVEDFKKLRGTKEFQEIARPKDLSGEEMLARATAAFDARDFALANHYYSNFLRINPGDARVKNLQVECLRQLEVPPELPAASSPPPPQSAMEDWKGMYSRACAQLFPEGVASTEPETIQSRPIDPSSFIAIYKAKQQEALVFRDYTREKLAKDPAMARFTLTEIVVATKYFRWKLQEGLRYSPQDELYLKNLLAQLKQEQGRPEYVQYATYQHFEGSPEAESLEKYRLRKLLDLVDQLPKEGA